MTDRERLTTFFYLLTRGTPRLPGLGWGDALALINECLHPVDMQSEGALTMAGEMTEHLLGSVDDLSAEQDVKARSSGAMGWLDAEAIIAYDLERTNQASADVHDCIRLIADKPHYAPVHISGLLREHDRARGQALHLARDVLTRLWDTFSPCGPGPFSPEDVARWSEVASVIDRLNTATRGTEAPPVTDNKHRGETLRDVAKMLAELRDRYMAHLLPGAMGFPWVDKINAMIDQCNLASLPDGGVTYSEPDEPSVQDRTRDALHRHLSSALGTQPPDIFGRPRPDDAFPLPPQTNGVGFEIAQVGDGWRAAWSNNVSIDVQGIVRETWNDACYDAWMGALGISRTQSNDATAIKVGDIVEVVARSQKNDPQVGYRARVTRVQSAENVVHIERQHAHGSTWAMMTSEVRPWTQPLTLETATGADLETAATLLDAWLDCDVRCGGDSRWQPLAKRTRGWLTDHGFDEVAPVVGPDDGWTLIDSEETAARFVGKRVHVRAPGGWANHYGTFPTHESDGRAWTVSNACSRWIRLVDGGGIDWRARGNVSLRLADEAKP